MDMKHLAEWLHEMQEITGGCTLEMRASGRAGIALELSWRQDREARSYIHAMSGTELQQMRPEAQEMVLEKIRYFVDSRPSGA